MTFSNYDPRNVLDEFKGKSVLDIRLELKKRMQPFAVLMEHIRGDFNISTLIRNANAFGAQEVFYIGKKKWDRRGAVGTHNYTSVTYISPKDLDELSKRYILVAAEQSDKSKPLETFEWPDKPVLMVFGEEGAGISPMLLDMCPVHVEITQHGSVRSLNAGTASGIVMYDFSMKRKNNGIHSR